MQARSSSRICSRATNLFRQAHDALHTNLCLLCTCASHGAAKPVPETPDFTMAARHSEGSSRYLLTLNENVEIYWSSMYQ